MERFTPPEAMAEADRLTTLVGLGKAEDYKSAEEMLQSPESQSILDFQDKYRAIMDRSISPENIDEYAEGALKDLIALMETATTSYSKETASMSRKALEDTALKAYGLNNVNEILDYISSKEKEIKDIDSLIKGAGQTGGVIVPSHPGNTMVVEGTGNFQEKLTIPRTKTILFILSNEFDVDISNPEQTYITSGVLTENMMRKIGYLQIEVPSLDRMILCCDEEGNITYIFDTKKLEEVGINTKGIKNLDKQTLDTIIESNPNCGKRVVYSKKFLANMVSLIKEIQTNEPTQGQETEGKTDENVGKYLYPKAPEGVYSLKTAAKALGVDFATAKAAMQRVGTSLGETSTYRFQNRPATGYTTEQVEMVRQQLVKQGNYSEQAPDGVLSVPGMAESFGLPASTIAYAISKLSDNLGEVTTYKFGYFPTKGYSSEQQSLIHEYLEENNYFLGNAPEDIKSAASYAKEIEIDPTRLEGIIANMGDTLGKVSKYKFSGHVNEGYDQAQQQLILEYLKVNGLWAQKAPEGYLSTDQFRKKLEIGHNRVREAINELSNYLGEIGKYRFGPQVTDGFSPSQQATIIQYLYGEGHLVEGAPEGILNAREVGRKLEVAQKTIQDAIESLGESLGEVNHYKYKSNMGSGYTPEQQELIKEYLDKMGILVEKAPPEVLSAGRIAKNLGRNNKIIDSAIGSLDDRLGEVKTYKFLGVITNGYTPEQQRMIIEKVESGG